jgi:hypothetical protein
VLHSQALIRRGVGAVVAWPRLGIASASGTRAAFLVDRPVFAAEAHSFWGPAGILLVWPAAFVVLWKGTPERRALAVGAVVFLLAQAFSGPYDPFRGRYFLSSAIVVAPLVADWLRPRGIATLFIAVAVVLTAAAGVGAALFRSGAPLVTVTSGPTYASIFSQDRAAQLTRQRPAYADAARRYEQFVPPDAVVADLLDADSFEYILWGPRLGRTILPVGNRSLNDAAFAKARYLVFATDRLAPRDGDILLGADWWLRMLPAGPAATEGKRSPQD